MMDEKHSGVTFWQRLQDGDQQAEEQLIHQYAPRLLRVAQSNLGQVVKRRLDPEDVVQSVFRTFIRRNAEGEFSLSSSDNLWRLLAKITVLKTREKARHHTAQKRNVRRESAPIEDEAPIDATLPEPGPDEAVALVELIEMLFCGLHSVYAKVVEMRLGGHSASEIAKALDVSRPTVYRALERAQLRLQDILSEAGDC